MISTTLPMRLRRPCGILRTSYQPTDPQIDWDACRMDTRIIVRPGVDDELDFLKEQWIGERVNACQS